MKTLARYSMILGLSVLLIVILACQATNPENLMEGKWKECRWEYERSDLQLSVKQSSETVKAIAGENLMIHKAEQWCFYPNGLLRLHGASYTRDLHWAIKGRGNILELKYGTIIEHYQLSQLTPKKLVLNFETETQMRGIARLTFERI
ncbi:hypothetical protein [Flavobacterium stagni]|uniref:Lipocalin-like domain-containing protein n=1 Tax=Flavobacterium stagni TaxID=2506421 RepID=A0A4Q1KCK9_9FLAO|nr:hypothetical protein [Flavobacterium stagni]RXR24249.1 hypothetical protein EQG61_02070 [Flavobacterium stagni]